MAPVDRLVVQRTWALLQSSRANGAPAGDGAEEPAPYGPDFVYDEYWAVPNALVGLIVSGAFALLGTALSFRPVRFSLLLSPCCADEGLSSSAGCSRSLSHRQARALQKRASPLSCVTFAQDNDADMFRRSLEKGWLKVTNVSSTAPDVNGKQTHVRTVLEGKGDPGYLLASGTSSVLPIPISAPICPLSPLRFNRHVADTLPSLPRRVRAHARTRARSPALTGAARRRTYAHERARHSAARAHAALGPPHVPKRNCGRREWGE